MTIGALLRALDQVGQVYRNKDGSQPADALKKLVQQFQAVAADTTLAEWIEAKRSGTDGKPNRVARAKPDEHRVEQALAMLDEAGTQLGLSAAIAALKLSAGEWQALCQKLTGSRPGSGKAARGAVEMHFSDRLLLEERVRGVKRQFRAATRPPAGA